MAALSPIGFGMNSLQKTQSIAVPLYIVVVNSTASVRSQIEALGNRGLLHVKEVEALGEINNNRNIDVLVLGKGVKSEDFALLGAKLDLSSTVVLGGPLPGGEIISAIKGLLGTSKAKNLPKSPENITLEDYVESKFSEFVRAMKASSARSLYATLIHAVERPMIELALRETRGNQIQAAQLLGLNRNTLRKKITECKISVKKRSRSQSKQASS